MKNSYSRIVWDIASMEVIECVGQSYDGPWELCKESGQQKAAQAQQNAFNKQLMGIYQQQFASQQAILGTIVPQLEAMAKNPEGFGATEYAALQANIVNDTGAQYSNIAKQAALQFATSNEAGLPSGVEAQVQGQIAAGAAGQVAGESSQLAIANEQMKQQQRDFALSGLTGIETGIGGQMQSTGGLAGQGLQNQFQNATTVYNQGGLWKNILGGLAGAGMGFLSGGLTNLTSGLGFLGGARGGGGGGG